MRLFLAIELNSEIKTLCTDLQGNLKESFYNARIVPYDNLHCTLLYFGEKDDNEYDEIDRIISLVDFEAFTVELTQCDFFTKKSGDICYCGIKESNALKELYNYLKNLCLNHEISFDQRAFKPHVTLARNVRLKNHHPIILPYVSKTSFICNSIVLFQSHRVKGQLTYTPLIRYGTKKDAE